MRKWYNEYINSLKMLEVEEVFDLIFYRPLAFLLVKLVYRTNLTPNQITIIAVVWGILGGISFAEGSAMGFFIGGILFILYDVFDCSDGQLARLKKNGTKIGRILDGFADYIATTAAYVGIGIGFANNTDNPTLYWGLTIAAGATSAVLSILLDFYRNRFLDIVLQRESVLENEIKEFEDEYEKIKDKSGKGFDKFIIRLYLRYSRLQAKMTKGNEEKSFGSVDHKLFYSKNKKLIHMWTYLGPTSQLTFMIICALFNRMDIYLIGMITIGNLYALIIYLWQNSVDKKLNLKGA